MVYVSIILLLLVVAVLMLHLRLRVEFSETRRTLFLGLGRTGPEIDFLDCVTRLRLCGLTIYRIRRADGREVVLTSQEKPSRRSHRRSSAPYGWLDTLPQIVRAGWEYIIGILRAIIIEHAEGEIRGGFDTPDVTGQVYGYYQAALAAAPSVVGRVRYVPDWTGQSFAMTGRFCASLPLYRLAWCTLVLLWRLPILTLIRQRRNTVRRSQV